MNKKQIADLSPEELKAYLDNHTVDAYTLLDVRQDWEYDEFHLPGAQLVPLPDLPDRMEGLAPDLPTLVYCASGGRSAVAASLLSGQGFREVYNILGGAMAWKNEYAVGPQNFGMIAWSGHESPLEILALAYRMEDNLGTFYRQIADDCSAEETGQTLKRLARFEAGHKARVWRAAQNVDPTLSTEDQLPLKVPPDLLEGGFQLAEFMAANQAYLANTQGVLEAAMIFEAQALDLYMRYAAKTGDAAAVKILHELAQEEKNHLKIIGRMMQRVVKGQPITTHTSS